MAMHFFANLFLLIVSIAFASGRPYKTDDDSFLDDGQLFEGDIVLTPTQKAQLRQRNAVLNAYRWPQNEIPYVIDERKINSATDLALIAQVIEFYRTKTCIQWIRRTTQSSYVNITRYGSGCYSNVGRAGSQWSQVLHLAADCMNFNAIVHEMMHTIGFFHEQSRSDRDGYVDILFQNIIDGMAYNFKKYTVDDVQTLDAPYDFNSIMHYGTLAFSKNDLPTILPRKPGAKIGQASTLSVIDLFKINKLYNCSSQIAGITFNPSQFNTFPPLPSTTPLPMASLPYVCTFDTDMCGMRDMTATFMWTRYRGDTPTPGTGPTQSSTGADGYYMYTEASGRLPDDSAILIMPQLPGKGPSCFSFKYHMYGSTMGRLEVDLYMFDQKYTLARLSGDRGNRWATYKNSFSILAPFRITFTGYIGSGYFSDMAIDDVSFTSGFCTY